jgi:hypothetical protein
VTYQIIDEPKPGKREQLVVDPTVILFLSIFIPLFWSPPLNGRFWIPFVWILANGWFMGSPTLRKEIGIALLTILAMVMLPFLSATVLETLALGISMADVVPYLRIVLFGMFFLGLYYIVFIQSVPYSIIKYLRELHE